MAHTTLVSTAQLAARLDDAAWVVFDCRHDLATPDSGAQEYAKAHIPGARFAGQPRAMSVGADDILGSLGRPGRIVIDARSPDRYRGENETLDPLGGRIPGSINRFFRENLDASACFRRAADLRQAFASLLGGMPPDAVVHSCGSGVAACHNLLAMEIAGLPGSRLYPGSWSEWCSDPSRPREKG